MTYSPDELFASAAPYYARYRPGYPPELFDYLATELRLTGTELALDIGCGTGQMAIPLARYVRRVTTIDPEPDMLAHGKAAGTAAGATNVDWVLGDAGRLKELGASGLLAVFAASFHWTSRPAVLRELDRLLEPGAAVVVIGHGRDDSEDTEWELAIAEIRARYLGRERRAGSGTFVHPVGGHAEVLADSPFADVRRVLWRWSRELTVEQAVGLQFSYSFSTPAMFGERAAEFAEEVRATLLARYPSGTVREPIGIEVLTARRP